MPSDPPDADLEPFVAVGRCVFGPEAFNVHGYTEPVRLYRLDSGRTKETEKAVSGRETAVVGRDQVL